MPGWDDLPPGAGFRRYWELLSEANRVHNLTRITSAEEFLEKHLLDALLGLAELPTAGSWVDVGSGGGVPGIPLALARPDQPALLVEATGKKAAFLQSAATALGLEQVRVASARAEELCRPGDPEREAHQAAVARAVGPIQTSLELCLPFVAIGGRVILYRGPQGAEEEDALAARAAPQLGGGPPRAVELSLPSGARRRLVIVEKVENVADRFPRRTGLAVKRPLS